MTDRNATGLRLILVATVVAGIGGYAIQWIAARWLGTDDYGVFIVFWAALYLILGGLSGVQQEWARATRRRSEDSNSRPALTRLSALAAVLGATAGIVVLLSSPLWIRLAFPDGGMEFVVPLAVGATIYVIVASTLGVLYGVAAWRLLSFMIVFDVAFRLVLILIALTSNAGIVVLAWATVIPFPVGLLIMALAIRAGKVVPIANDGNLRLIWNALRTVVASCALAALVSGFPLLLRVTTPEASSGVIGALSLAITLTRAPLVVTTMALQSYLVVYFRERLRGTLRLLTAGLIGLAVVAAIIALIALVVGKPVVSGVFGDAYGLSGEVLGLLVASSFSTGALVVTGSLVLAYGRHSEYTSGWVVAALASTALLLIPMPIESKVIVALTFGPLFGLAVHAFAVVTEIRQRRSG